MKKAVNLYPKKLWIEPRLFSMHLVFIFVFCKVVLFCLLLFVLFLDLIYPLTNYLFKILCLIYKCLRCLIFMLWFAINAISSDQWCVGYKNSAFWVLCILGAFCAFWEYSWEESMLTDGGPNTILFIISTLLS